MKRLILIATLVLLSSTMCSAFSLFGGYSKIRVTDGEANFAIYRTPCADAQSFIGYWKEGMDVPCGVFILVTYKISADDQKHPGRPVWIWVSAPGKSVSSPLEKKFGGPKNVALLDYQDPTMYLECWYEITRVAPVTFFFGAVPVLKKETGPASSVTVPVSPVPLDDWIQDPHGSGVTPQGVQQPQPLVQSIVQQSPLPVVLQPKTSVAISPDVVNFVTTSIVSKGNTMTIKMVNSNGNRRYDGSGTVWITLSGKTTSRTIANGMSYRNDGLSTTFDGSFKLSNSAGKTYAIKATGFARSEIKGDIVILYGGK